MTSGTCDRSQRSLGDAGEIVVRRAFLASILAMLVSANLLFSAAGAPGGPVPFACSGAKADAARKAATDNNLPHGLNPKACFGEMRLTESARKQIVVALPSQHCKAGQLLNVNVRSRAGPWYALFTQPVCGTSIAVGPKRPYGDNMITIDGRSYIDKAGEFVPFKYLAGALNVGGVRVLRMARV
jgi:hypothetical protein